MTLPWWAWVLLVWGVFAAVPAGVLLAATIMGKREDEAIAEWYEELRRR